MSDAQRDFSVGMRVRVHPGTDRESLGEIVDDFGEMPGRSVDIGDTRIADPARRWAVILDAGTVVFLDSHQLDAAPH